MINLKTCLLEEQITAANISNKSNSIIHEYILKKAFFSIHNMAVNTNQTI